MSLAIPLLLLSFADIKYRIIPKRLTFLTYLLLLQRGNFSILLWALWIFLGYLFLFHFSKGGIGYGDVRLAPLAALVAGEANPLLIHLVAWCLAGLFLILRGKLHSSLPFAPFFSLSLLIITHL